MVVTVMKFVSIVVNHWERVGKMCWADESFRFSDTVALKKGQDSVEPCLEPHVIITMSLLWIVVIWVLVKGSDSVAYSV